MTSIKSFSMRCSQDESAIVIIVNKYHTFTLKFDHLHSFCLDDIKNEFSRFLKNPYERFVNILEGLKAQYHLKLNFQRYYGYV